MTPKPNPFSLYDFLGYFTPGATALYAFNYYVHGTSDRLEPLTRGISQAATLEEPASFIPFVLLAYLLGHILSFLSSITVERYYLWVFDYPSKELLNVARHSFFEEWKVARAQNIVRLAVAAFVAPIAGWDLFLRKAAGFEPVFKKTLDPLLASLLRNKTLSLITTKGGISDPDKHGKPSDHDFFRYVYHFAVEHAPNHLPKMQNYVALYGFLRTMAFLGVVVFWSVLFTAAQWSTSLLDVFFWCFSISIVTYVLFLGFMKFYRRFSLEAFMAMSVTFSA